ncbi:hypothetical protein [Leptolyngbya sp. FACHB-711]|uniref:hypothetical protein n=1 Tax=unclassified Leptolyngbya TaxID=2650499 RepID=UPI0016888C15|nr:hypothetical protein [Leptolyngbya sp. FACHB-711]MBD2024794.1 hypothetical protein [Leptolyngbya sp. FACHB-711]
MLVALLQQERCVSIERLATLFAQPIQFESRRRNLQRFLQLTISTTAAVESQNSVVAHPQILAEAAFPSRATAVSNETD